MALGDNLTFYHSGAALASDYPAITPTNPASTGNPSVSSGALEFDSSGDGDGLQFAHPSAEFMPDFYADGDFTVAIRVRIDSGQNTLFHLGTSGVQIWVANSTNREILISDSASAQTYSEALAFEYAAPLTVVFVRENGVMALYFDGSEETISETDDFGAVSFNSDTYDQLCLGVRPTGFRPLQGAIDFAAFWTRALTPTEIANNINETDLGAAIGGGASVAPDIIWGSSTVLGAPFFQLR